MATEYDIVIIGAGAAGISAARQLSTSKLKTLVIEALPRTGGRAWTYQAEDVALDLGCGWLHSAGRNPWTQVAEQSGFTVERGKSAWGEQYRDLGFLAGQQADAREAFAQWSERLEEAEQVTDIASDLLDPACQWNAYIQALSGFISGDQLERISIRDYLAYDEASTEDNWRLPAGYGTLISHSMPPETEVRLSTPIEALSLGGRGVDIRTASGTISARAAIVTVSSNVLAGDTIIWPGEIDAWREAAKRLPLGSNEKLFLEISGESPFEPETHVIGDPFDASSGSYYIRPFGRPVIECFLGGAGARKASLIGKAAAFAAAIDQLEKLFGSDVRKCLKPLVSSDWAGTVSVGGGYSHALPGHAEARIALAVPFRDKLFFAGEATHRFDFSTAHGAYESGMRAAKEVIEALDKTGLGVAEKLQAELDRVAQSSDLRSGS